MYHPLSLPHSILLYDYIYVFHKFSIICCIYNFKKVFFQFLKVFCLSFCSQLGQCPAHNMTSVNVCWIDQFVYIWFKRQTFNTIIISHNWLWYGSAIPFWTNHESYCYSESQFCFCNDRDLQESDLLWLAENQNSLKLLVLDQQPRCSSQSQGLISVPYVDGLPQRPGVYSWTDAGDPGESTDFLNFPLSVYTYFLEED